MIMQILAKHWLVVTAATMLLSACTEQAPAPPSQPMQQLTMPWLAECESQLVGFFDKAKASHSGFNYSLVRFNLSFKPLSSLRGYVYLQSNQHSFAEITQLAQAASAGCYPDSSRRLALTDTRLQEKIVQTISVAQYQGAKQLYADISPEHLEIYFSQASGGKK